MPLTRSSARRYAEAAFEIAERDRSMDTWLTALEVAEERLGDAAVVRVLGSPAVPAGARIAVLDRILGDDVGGAPRNLLALLIRRGRFELLPAVIRELRRLHREREGIVEARVTSARALDRAEIVTLEERLVALTGDRIELEHDVDPELLGGLQVRVGDTLIDGSVRGRLERLRNTFVNAAI